MLQVGLRILPCVSYAKTQRDTHWYPLFQDDALISISHPSHRVVVPGKSPRPPPTPSPHAAPTCTENARPPHRRWREERVPAKGRGELCSSLSLSRFRSAARTSRMGGYPTRWIFWLRASYVIHHSSLFNQVFLGLSRKGTISES